MAMRPVMWCFDDCKPYPGFTDDTYWNGFLNVWITPEVRALVAADESIFNEDQWEHSHSLLEIEPDDSGLISLAYGYATQECEES